MKVHQNIELNGVDIGENKTRKGSKFCNEGKWENFIEPFLKFVPIEEDDFSDLTFLEIGCNAGLFLKLAKLKGFGNVIGFDEMEDVVEIGKKYRDESGLNYKIYHDSIHQDYDFSQLPLADVALLANVHYHLTIPCFVHLLDALKYKARYVIIVSDEKGKTTRRKPRPELEKTREYFSGWTEVQTIYPLPREGDPHPRRLYSIMYKSELRRIPLKKLILRSVVQGKRYQYTKEFMERALKERFDVRRTKFYQSIKKQHRNPEDPFPLIQFCQDKKQLVRDIQKNGMKKPIFIDKYFCVFDGGHRFIAMDALGYKSIITRIL